MYSGFYGSQTGKRDNDLHFYYGKTPFTLGDNIRKRLINRGYNKGFVGFRNEGNIIVFLRSREVRCTEVTDRN